MAPSRFPAGRYRRPSRYGRWLPVWLLHLAGILTCSTPEERYQTLSFFFDGVPKPGEEADAPGAPGAKTPSSPTPGKSAAPSTVQHGPYAGGYCTACHAGPFRPDLRRELTELCRSCHVEWKPGGKNVHGPVASGRCTGCHNPHESKNTYMLVDTGGALCLRCHTSQTFPGLDDHRENMGEVCTECHDPHASDEEFYLR